MSQLYALCPTCGEVIEAELVDNGVCIVLHGVHCGFGHHLGSLDDAFLTRSEAESVRDYERVKKSLRRIEEIEKKRNNP